MCMLYAHPARLIRFQSEMYMLRKYTDMFPLSLRYMHIGTDIPIYEYDCKSKGLKNWYA